MEGKEKGRGKIVGQFGSTKNSTLSISYVYRPPLSLLSSLLATFIGHQRGFNLSIRGGHRGRCQRHLFSRFWTRPRSLSRLNDTDAYRFNLYHRFFWTKIFDFSFCHWSVSGSKSRFQITKDYLSYLHFSMSRGENQFSLLLLLFASLYLSLFDIKIYLKLMIQ